MRVILNPIVYTVTVDLAGGKVESGTKCTECGMYFDQGTACDAIRCIYKGEHSIEKPYVIIDHTVKREGYSLAGWNVVVDGVLVKTLDKSGARIDCVQGLAEDGKTVNLIAKWYSNEYNITFDANGGSIAVNNPVSVEYDAAYDLSPYVPVRAGYRFDGWYYGIKDYTRGDRWDIADEGVTLTAKWTAYTITYDAGGGILNERDSLESYTDAKAYTLPAPSKIGFVFIGWYNGSDYVGNANEVFVPSYAASATVSLTAMW